MWNSTGSTQGITQPARLARRLNSPSKLQIGLIQAGLLLPSGDPKPEDLVIARMYTLIFTACQYSNTADRWHFGNWCILEYTDKGCTFIRSLFLAITNVLHRLQVSPSLMLPYCKINMILARSSPLPNANSLSVDSTSFASSHKIVSPTSTLH